MIKTLINNKITPNDIIESDFIHHIIMRDEVENMDFKRIKETLKVFEKMKKHSKNKLMITFIGYIDIPKEVYEIDENRKYVESLFNEFPHIFYFLADADGTSTVFLLCLCELKRINRTSSFTVTSICTESINRKIIDGILDYGTRIEENETDLREMIDRILRSKPFTRLSTLTLLERDISLLKSLDVFIN